VGAAAVKFFLVVVFFKFSPEPVYFGPFETEAACFRWDYLRKSGVYYGGTCKLLDPASVPVHSS
jgi:hypothetical protein